MVPPPVSLLLLLSTCLILCTYFDFTRAQGGLSLNFYDSSCPKLESIVRKQLKKEFKNEIGQAAGLLRLHFHDCFVQGCGASVLLDGSASGPSERSAPPNLNLRAEAFRIIDDLRRRIHNKCGRVVSCADIVALSARDSVFLKLFSATAARMMWCNKWLELYEAISRSHLHHVLVNKSTLNEFNYLLHHVIHAAIISNNHSHFLDSTASLNAQLANLPAPSSNTTALLTSLATKNFTTTDVVALSGGHTIGISHCTSFTNRLYPTQDPIMDKTFATNLKTTCPTADSNNTVMLDIRSPNSFDNKYYVDLMNRQGLFTSDQDLYTDSRTRGIVTSFAVNQTLFFEKFVSAMIKMSHLSVLTGREGEIRANCSVVNSKNVLLSSVVGEEQGTSLAF